MAQPPITYRCVRFCPSDVEIFTDFLIRKHKDEDMADSLIEEFDFYKEDPISANLPYHSYFPQKNYWYFVNRTRVSAKSKKADRSIRLNPRRGKWLKYGRTVPILSGLVNLGTKKIYNYIENGVKSGWIMEEFESADIDDVFQTMVVVHLFYDRRLDQTVAVNNDDDDLGIDFDDFDAADLELALHEDATIRELSGAKGEESVKEFFDRFPIPVFFSALQTESNIIGYESTLLTCLERVVKTNYGASLIPQFMPFLQGGLKADSTEVKSLACKTVTCLLENYDAEDVDVSPVQLVVSNGIYPLLLDSIINSNDEVAHAASETIKRLARFPDAMSVIFLAETDDATHLGNLAAGCSSLARARILSLLVKLFSISPHVALEIKNSGLLGLLEAEVKGTNDSLVISSVLTLYYELMEVEHSSEFVPQTSIIQLLCSIISGTSVDPSLKLRAMMISGRLLSKENIYNFVEEACVEEFISALDDGSLESMGEIALEAIGQIGSTTKGANLVLSTSPPAARHVVAYAFDCNAQEKQLAALHALAYIAGEKRPKNSRIVDEKAEESLRCLIYDVAAQSTQLTPSGLFLSALQQSSEIRLAGYRTLTALVARPWCLMEILSKEEIINIVTDATIESAQIAMEARYICCKSMHEASLCSYVVADPRLLEIGEKLEEAVQRGP